MKKIILLISSAIFISSCGNAVGVPSKNIDNNNGINNNAPVQEFNFGSGSGYTRYGAGRFGGQGQGVGVGQGMGQQGQGLGQGFSNNDYLKTNLDAVPIAELKDEEKADLAYMIEEEKMARDIYILLYDKWKVRSFDNISKSEQIHIDSIKLLLDRHKLDNTISDQKGVFKNTKIQELYNTLSKEGLESLEKAINVGGKVEEVDIKDLSEKLAKTSSKDIQIVFDALMSASENHLRAFSSNLNMFFKKEYTPSFLSKEDYQKIVSN